MFRFGCLDMGCQSIRVRYISTPEMMVGYASVRVNLTRRALDANAARRPPPSLWKFPDDYERHPVRGQQDSAPIQAQAQEGAEDDDEPPGLVAPSDDEPDDELPGLCTDSAADEDSDTETRKVMHPCLSKHMLTQM